jgi:hypothetical protein
MVRSNKIAPLPFAGIIQIRSQGYPALRGSQPVLGTPNN